jgi:hypothetical protein
MICLTGVVNENMGKTCAVSGLFLIRKVVMGKVQRAYHHRLGGAQGSAGMVLRCSDMEGIAS